MFTAFLMVVASRYVYVCTYMYVEALEIPMYETSICFFVCFFVSRQIDR